MNRSVFVLWLLGFGFSPVLFGQSDSLKTYHTRKTVLWSSVAGVGGASLLYLNQAWYKEYQSGEFHFFNDNGQWLQVDKVGHAFAAYQSGRLMMDAFDWAGYSRSKKLFIGGAIGLYYLSIVECMDGFSQGWGFSWGDELSNVVGSALAIAQEAFWTEQRIQLKFFYHNSGLAGYNAALLGEEAYTRPLKDYNGQSYWLSVNPSSFFKRRVYFPRWLSVSLGYGAYGMIGAENNPPVYDENGQPLTFERYRRFYLSLDLDLTRIPVRSAFLKSLFSLVNVIKFPCPTLEYSQGTFRFHTFYP